MNTEIAEHKRKLQTSNSKLQRSSNRQAPKSHHPSLSDRAPFRSLIEALMSDFGILLGLPAIAFSCRNHLPAWVFMWLMAFAIFLGCKWLTWRRALTRKKATTLQRYNVISEGPWKRRYAGLSSLVAYMFFWPGMDPQPFLSPAGPKPERRKGWRAAVLFTAIGGALMFAAVRLSNGNQSLCVGWLVMLGIISFLHFGVFALVARGWNGVGVGVKPVMRAPVGAKSLGEFWGARWNTAFNDLARELVFLPLVRVLGTAQRHGWRVGLATMAVFVVSGVVHELVISVPARGGYGLPTGYFILQGLGVLFEKSGVGRRIGLGRGARGWLFTMACAAGPAFWLFQPLFVRNVILPMLQAFGGN